MHIYDFVAIGGGNAGLTATAAVKAKGMKVALVDRGPIGGLCSLNGCNPKKVLVRSSEVLDEARRAGEFGIRVQHVEPDWQAVLARKQSFTSGVTEGSMKSLAKKQIDFIPGQARFTAPGELEVGGEKVRARGVLIATGSVPRSLTFPGADLVSTSDDVLALDHVPESMVLIGAGVVGMELGHVFARAGSKVTVLEPTARLLGGADSEVAGLLLEHSRKLDMKLHFAATVQSVARRGSRLVVEYEAEKQQHSVEADLVLNAAGRVPAITELDLDAGNISRSGPRIAVTDYLRNTSNPAVFAAGDAHGRLQLSPIASYEGRIAARNFLEGDVERADYGSVPSVVFTIPALAMVGLTEEAAGEKGVKHEVFRSDMADWKVYAIAGERPAFAKVLLEPDTGRILGAHVLGPGAAETIHIYALAMRFQIPASDLKKMVFVYPTFSGAIPHTMG